MKREYQEFTGKTVEEAVRDGLRELGLKEEEADIRVLEEGKKKLFGYVKARVEIAPKGGDEEAEASAEAEEEKKAEEKKTEVHCDANGRTDGERAVEFLEGLFDILKITASTELRREEEKIEINVTAANTNAVIGKRGAMLDAIQTIAGAVANTGRDEYKRVVVDCENYRENRELTLQNLANKLAEKAIRFEKKLKLEPMNPYERRIIHAALSGREDVTTQSEGKEPYRYIVIVPSNVRYPDRPASPAREERPQRGYGGRGYNGGYRKPYDKDLSRDGEGYKKPYNREGGYKKPYNKDVSRDGERYGKPYNRDGEGYKKPYNKDYGRDDGYRKPYNRDGEGYRKPYNRDSERGEGGTDLNGERKPYDKPRTSSYKKPSSDFFGTYLGNSKDNQDKE